MLPYVDLTYSLDPNHPINESTEFNSQYQFICNIVQQTYQLRAHVANLLQHTIQSTDAAVGLLNQNNHTNNTAEANTDRYNNDVASNNKHTVQHKLNNVLQAYNHIATAVLQRIEHNKYEQPHEVQRYDILSVRYDTARHNQLETNQQQQLLATESIGPSYHHIIQPVVHSDIDSIIHCVRQYSNTQYKSNIQLKIDKLYDTSNQLTSLQLLYPSLLRCIIYIQYNTLLSQYQPIHCSMGMWNELIDHNINCSYTYQSSNVVYQLIQLQVSVLIHNKQYRTLYELLLYITSYRNIMSDQCDYCSQILSTESDTTGLNGQLLLPCIVHTYTQPMKIYHISCHTYIQQIAQLE